MHLHLSLSVYSRCIKESHTRSHRRGSKRLFFFNRKRLIFLRSFYFSCPFQFSALISNWSKLLGEEGEKKLYKCGTSEWVLSSFFFSCGTSHTIFKVLKRVDSPFGNKEEERGFRTEPINPSESLPAYTSTVL